MIEETSAGAVVFIEDGERLFLLLKYIGGHWDFPKGHVEMDESLHTTARREILEETGLEVEFLPGFEKTIDYTYRRHGETFHKKVVFFLARAKSRDVRLSKEHLDYVWLPYDKAMEKVTYDNARYVLRSAKEFMDRFL